MAHKLHKLLTSKANLISTLPKYITTGTAQYTQTKPAVAAATIPSPNFDGQPKVYSAKIEQLVTEISNLKLAEAADLNELLRKRLNIKDVAMSYAMPGAGPAVAAKKEEAEPEEAALPKAVKTSFKLKLVKFDEAKKVAIIKEIKSLGDNINLVQAKKFIESLPQVFKDNISKEDAEKLKAQFEKAGAKCEIE